MYERNPFLRENPFLRAVGSKSPRVVALGGGGKGKSHTECQCVLLQRNERPIKLQQGLQPHLLAHKRKEMSVEDILWLGLALWLTLSSIGHDNDGVRKCDWSAMTSFLCALWTAASNNPKKRKSYWKGRSDADSGAIMSTILIPACLEGDQKFASLFAIMLTQNNLHNRLWVLALCVMMSLYFALFSPDRLVDSLGFVFIWWWLSIYCQPTLENCLTLGEFQILVSLGTACILAWVRTSWDDISRVQDTESINPTYATVAMSGVIGCALSLVLTQRFFRTLHWRILVCGATPLLVVELSLWIAGGSYHDNSFLLPLWYQWLLDFLQSPEEKNPHDETGAVRPRYFGLVYWFLVAVLLIPPTMQITTKQSVGTVVVRRKWFHLIAIVLFGPVTWTFPELMALSYAIALCGLAILESLRREIPALQWFYKALIDPHKDNANDILFSHIFLILGCAMPLWTNNRTVRDDNWNGGYSLLLSQWGILSLGVGDAMGAIVGTYFGKHRWGRNRRTLEGSAAMWLSMLCVGLAMSPTTSWPALLLTTTYTALLEAYTLQMDNFILPLAGVVLLLRLGRQEL